MNDEEEVVVTDSNPEQTSEQETSNGSSIKTGRGKSLGDRLDDVSSTINNVGKTVENFGKGEEKFADLIDGGEKGVNVAAKAGEAASSAAEKGTKAAEKVADARAKAAHATAEGAKSAKNVSKVVKTASEAADRGAEAGKAASKSLESNQYTAAVGAVGEAVSTAGQVAAKTTKAGSTVSEAASGTAEGAARAAETEAKTEKAALNAAKAAEKTAKAGTKATSKATEGSFADKLRKHGKLNQMHGKRMQELSKKFNSDEFIDDLTGKFGIGGKMLKTVFGGIIKAFDPKTIIIVTTLLVVIINTIIVYILSPMFYMNEINKGVNDGTIDKVQNFISGLGFRSSEEAFYKEVNYLNTHYGKELDFPYIMATLYYVDIFYGGSSIYGQNGDFCESISDEESKNKCDKLTLGYRLAKKYFADANSSIGEDGLTYSSHKLYRLRELAKHQFAGDMTEVSVTLTEYLELCSERLKNEIGNLTDYIPMLIIYVLCSGNPLFSSYIDKIKALQGFNDFLGLLDGTENWKSIELYIKNGEGNFNGAKQALKNLLEVFFGSFYNIKGITINIGAADELNSTENDSSSGDGSDKCTGANERLSSDGKTCICKKYYARDNNGSCQKKDVFSILLEKATDSIQVEYYKESYSQDEYENYLVDHYIREMPEFSNLIRDGGKIDDEKVLNIAYQIRSTKELFDGLYKKDESAEDDTKCIGNINLDLLSELNNPIDLTDGQKITFSGTNIYGLYKGKVHHGVDLEELSTGTKAGANVYSLYDGKVISSTVDNTYSDKNAKGGWVVIEYTVQYEDSSLGESKLAERFKNHISRIQVYYGGLSANDLKLKKGSTVKKGEVIGHVGSAAESENGIRPSLHFAIYDVINNNFLNPINMFITCSSGTNNKMCGVTNEQKVWTFLLSKGYTKEAAAGIMGVWKRESSFKPYIVQGHSDSFSKSYTADVDSGKITKNKFKNDKIGGGGYGLAQWTTSSRKENLYEYAKKKGKSIGDLEVQLEFFDKEINSGSYKGIKSKMNNADSVDETTKIFLRDFEGGGSSSLKLRTGYAKDIYNKYKTFSCK